MHLKKSDGKNPSARIMGAATGTRLPSLSAQQLGNSYSQKKICGFVGRY
jgi:hypothetical protein